MRILMTGATGFIGKKLYERLIKNHEIYCVGRISSEVEKKELYETVGSFLPDVLIHLAGLFLSDHSIENIDDIIDSNIKYAALVFDAACESGCRKVINTASCWQQYDGKDYEPVNLYAASKQAAEDILNYYVVARGMSAVTLTIFDSYGPNDNRRKIMNILRNLKDNETIDLTMGEQKIYLVYIDDIVDAYEHTLKKFDVLSKNGYRKYAVRGENPESLRNIAERYFQISDKNVYVNWGARKYRYREIMDPTGWGTPLPGWIPKTSLEEGLKRI